MAGLARLTQTPPSPLKNVNLEARNKFEFPAKIIAPMKIEQENSQLASLT